LAFGDPVLKGMVWIPGKSDRQLIERRSRPTNRPIQQQHREEQQSHETSGKNSRLDDGHFSYKYISLHHLLDFVEGVLDLD
jgi:hypothetical protein